MTIGSINSNIANIQLLRAKQAFINNDKLAKEGLAKHPVGEEDVKLSISSQQIEIPENKEVPAKKEENFLEKNKSYLGEIKNFIGENSFNQIGEDDLKEALRYGKSILADYTA